MSLWKQHEINRVITEINDLRVRLMADNDHVLVGFALANSGLLSLQADGSERAHAILADFRDDLLECELNQVDLLETIKFCEKLTKRATDPVAALETAAYVTLRELAKHRGRKPIDALLSLKNLVRELVGADKN